MIQASFKWYSKDKFTAYPDSCRCFESKVYSILFISHKMSLVACSSLSRAKWNFLPFMWECLLILTLFWYHLFSHFQERLLHSRFPVVLILKIYMCSPLRHSLSHRCRSCDVLISTMAGLGIIYWLLHWAHLWLFFFFCDVLHLLQREGYL